MGDNMVLVDELNKLEKADLIEILLYKNLSKKSNSDVINSFVAKLNCPSEKAPKFSELSDSFNNQKNSDKYIRQLEERVREQANVISFLLNSTQKETDGRPLRGAHAVSHVQSEENPNDLEVTKQSTKAVTNKGCQSDDANSEAKNENNSKEEDVPNFLMGQNEGCLDKYMGVSAAPKSWLFVSFLNPNLQGEEILQYLREAHERHDFVCIKLGPSGIVNPTYSSFKIGIDPSLENKLLNSPELWPKGVLVKKYRFKKFSIGTAQQNYKVVKLKAKDSLLQALSKVMPEPREVWCSNLTEHVHQCGLQDRLLRSGNVTLPKLSLDVSLAALGTPSTSCRPHNEPSRAVVSHKSTSEVNRPSTSSKTMHKTCCFRPADDDLEGLPEDIVISTERLEVAVKYATYFSDTAEFNKTECYRTRSKNRGLVLIINNMEFSKPDYRYRSGAEIDESNLNTLFTRMGFHVEMFRNLTAVEMEMNISKFTKRNPCGDPPDMGILIIMSHGEKFNDKTFMVGTCGNFLEEHLIVEMFNNQHCKLFRDRPKILIFHVCRGDFVDDFTQYTQHTQRDSACSRKPECHNDDRVYSDIIVCHPSMEGFQAHRDTVRGTWYMELICMVFMENAHEVDIESMLKLVEQRLKKRISEKRTRQTSTFLNIAFKTCYLHPGIYQEDGKIVRFEQSV